MATEKQARPDSHGHDHGHHHRDVSGGWLRPAVFGAMDGLVTNSSLIAGIGGGGGGHGAIVLTGIAGLIAGAFSIRPRTRPAGRARSAGSRGPRPPRSRAGARSGGAAG